MILDMKSNRTHGTLAFAQKNASITLILFFFFFFTEIKLFPFLHDYNHVNQMQGGISPILHRMKPSDSHL